jgi:hypothetical protein
MRALRLPLPAVVPPDPATVPAWIIDGERRSVDERREAPRLEVPRDGPLAPLPRDRVSEPLPGSTVIVIPI